MCRRRDFYLRHPEQRPGVAEENGEVIPYSHIYTPDESISLSLEYYNNNETEASEQEVCLTAILRSMEKMQKKNFFRSDVNFASNERLETKFGL